MERIIGIDVSKDSLDAATLPTGQSRKFTNDAAGIAELVEWARPFNPERIIFESTGNYQKAAVGALLAGALPAVTVHITGTTSRPPGSTAAGGSKLSRWRKRPTG